MKHGIAKRFAAPKHIIHRGTVATRALMRIDYGKMLLTRSCSEHKVPRWSILSARKQGRSLCNNKPVHPKEVLEKNRWTQGLQVGQRVGGPISGISLSVAMLDCDLSFGGGGGIIIDRIAHNQPNQTFAE